MRRPGAERGASRSVAVVTFGQRRRQAEGVMVTSPGLDLYWIPLGAGQRVVRTSGSIYERIVAAGARRPRRDLYHFALVATTAEGRVTIEMAPQPDDGRRVRS
jgi:hypothetical protein